MATYKQNDRRRGVILLVLLGMLALFGATAFAFVVIASHGNRAAKSLQRVDRVLFTPREDLEEAMRQALRDTRSTASVLRDQSLLMDIYGEHHIGGWVINSYTLTPTDAAGAAGDPTGWVNPKLRQGDDSVYMPPNAKWPTTGGIAPDINFATTRGNGQIIEFIAGYTIPEGRLNWTGNPMPVTFTAPYRESGNDFLFGQSGQEFRRRVGCVLTIVDQSSELFGMSTRIIGYRRQEIRATPSDPVDVIYHRYQILPFEGVAPRVAVNYFLTTQSTSNNFIINGTPFSGNGAGLNSASTGDTRNEREYPTTLPTGVTPTTVSIDQVHALLPNPTDTQYYDNVPYNDRRSWGNEDYDAPDFQNMLLALEHYDGIAMTLTRDPSLHRPELAKYWLDVLFTEFNAVLADAELTWRVLIQPYGKDGIRGNADDPSVLIEMRDIARFVKRRCLMRPLGDDHPNFTGSNSRWPNFTNVDLDLLDNDPDAATVPELYWMAHQSWGAIDLVPGNARPWLVDTNGDGIPDGGTQVIPWDVDNDGDGWADSIWVDIGLPVRTLPDGRKYRPLVAIHCIDLDGKVNLNTAGSIEQLHHIMVDTTGDGNPDTIQPQYDGNVATGGYCPTDSGGLLYAQDLPLGAARAVDLARGQGCGTAEINPYYIFQNITSTKTLVQYQVEENDPTLTAADLQSLQVNDALNYYRNLLLGRPDLNLDGRYGELAVRDTRNFTAATRHFTWTPNWYPVTYHLPAPGMSGGSDAPETLAKARLLNIPSNYCQAVTQGTTISYGSPMDLRGSLAVGLDPFGQPIYTSTRSLTVTNGGDPSFITGWRDQAWTSGDTDSPYELKLGDISPQAIGHNSRLDNAFSVAELEPILRRYDADVLRLPSRLRRLLNAGPNSPFRLQTTTASWDVPVPGMSLPDDLRTAWNKAGLGTPQHISDLIVAKIQALYEVSRFDTGNPDPGNPGHNIWANLWLPSTCYYPYFQPVSEPPDPASDTAWRVDETAMLSSEVLAGLRMDLNRPFESDTDRREFAKTLYVLMMMLVDRDWYPPWSERIQNPQSVPGPYPQQDTATAKAIARAHAIAQWAVNIVDARDSDSIMTAFEYDIYPFAANLPVPAAGETIKTWNVDLDPSTVNTDPIDDGPTRGVVWGCERPELLLTETLALHDRGTDDTDLDSTGEYTASYTPPGADPDFDQVFRPQGSLFVELYNPWGLSEPGPDELYSTDTPGDPGYGVQLARVTPGAGAHPTPVWRLAVVKEPDGMYKDPDDEYLWGSVFTDKYDRLIYFVPNDYASGNLNTVKLVCDPQDSLEATVFYPNAVDNNRMPIGPQSYAVIGPGDDYYGTVTRIGESRTQGVDSEQPEASLRRVSFTDSDGDNVYDVDVFADGQASVIDTMAGAGAIKQPVGMVVNRAVPYPPAGDFADPANEVTRRLSVSEPNEGYLADDPAALGYTYNPKTGYFNTGTNTLEPLDAPEDKTRADAADEWQDPVTGVKALAMDGTTPVYRYIHLQRLADPTRPYDRNTNPYITIDTAPVDLTVFNTASSLSDPEVDTSTLSYAFCSRQRGEPRPGAAGTPGTPGPLSSDSLLPERFWTSFIPMADSNPGLRDYPNCEQDTPLDGSVTGSHAFAERFGQTLGFLNEFMFSGTLAEVAPHYYGAPLNPDTFSLPAYYRGAPGEKNGSNFDCNPFPWLQWLNRPFANAYELMDVAATQPSRLLVSYVNESMQNEGRYGDGTDVPTPRLQYTGGRAPFPHLLSFFNAIPGLTVEGQMRGSSFFHNHVGSLPVPGDSPVPVDTTHLYRLFEYVHVPSRFIDSQIRGNPDSTYGLDITGDPHNFHPPRNFISTYREPGKINLNTISSSVVWQCLMNDHDVNSVTTANRYMPEWDDFLISRRGYGAANQDVRFESGITPTLPTRIARPFRSPGGADYVPPLYNRGNPNCASSPPPNPRDLAEMGRGGINYATGVSDADVEPGNGVDANLLRTKWPVDTAEMDAQTPLFTPYNQVSGAAGYKPLDDTARNPHFKYQSLQRLSNLATTRSNVYALWITVGYFEVENRDDYDPTVDWQQQVYRDGYTLGQELGIDTGDVTRYRAFYIIDRSIPVGFNPGQDLNAEKAVLLRRFIE